MGQETRDSLRKPFQCGRGAISLLQQQSTYFNNAPAAVIASPFRRRSSDAPVANLTAAYSRHARLNSRESSCAMTRIRGVASRSGGLLPAVPPSPIASPVPLPARPPSPLCGTLPIFTRGSACARALVIIVGTSTSPGPLLVILVFAARHQGVLGVDNLALGVYSEALRDAAAASHQLARFEIHCLAGEQALSLRRGRGKRGLGRGIGPHRLDHRLEDRHGDAAAGRSAAQ